MPLPPYGSILNVRPEVLDPRGLIDMVDLGLVGDERRPRGVAARAPGADVLRDPAAFFDITFPTTEIVHTLQTLARRALTPEAVPGTILLSGHYGQGKSHVLLAAHHALRAPAAAGAWAARWGIDLPAMVADPIVLTRSFIQNASEPLWEMLLKARGHNGSVGDFPDGELITSLLGERPIFLIMDELERWYDAQDELSKSRNRNFLQALTEVAQRDGRLTLLTTVLGERKEPAETIRRIKPLELSFRSAEDRERVALFRLFSNRDDVSARQAATQATDAAMHAWQAAGVVGLDGLRARMMTTWPFTPEFMDILTKKVPNLGGFQATRGTLRFLALVVAHTCTRRPFVSSQDLPLHDDVLRQALTNLDTTGGEVVRRALGDNYEAVAADVHHRDELFSALVFYSIADPTHPGATLDELLLAVLDPDENPIRVRDALAQIKQRAFNLHERDQRYVFLAVENPRARVTAMASSQLVTHESARAHVREAIEAVWGGREHTTLFDAMHDGSDWQETARRLGAVTARPRVLLSMTTLTPAQRLKAQNLLPDRNLVLLVEPCAYTSTGETTWSLLSDATLIHHARRVEACKLLLEGRPAVESARVYRDVRDDDAQRLRKAVAERLAIAIAWHRAGATGAAVDDTWYEVCRLEQPTCAGLLDTWRADHTGLPEIESVIRRHHAEFRNRAVDELVVWFERTPGLPVPLEASWVPTAVRKLAREGLFGLVARDGATLLPDRVATLPEAELRTCTLGDPQVARPPDEPETPITHPRVSAHFDPARAGVLVSWTWPPSPGDGSTWTTLVQRYTTARAWTVGGTYPLDTEATHAANRYLGADAEMLDVERLQPGQWYHYYVFLVRNRPDGTSTFTLSQRSDVGIPHPEPAPPGVILTAIHSDPIKLTAEVERIVMSGKQMTSTSVVRKVVVTLQSVADPQVSALAGRLPDRAGAEFEASADLTFTSRGSFSRQDVLALMRLLPRYAGARYSAELHLQGET